MILYGIPNCDTVKKARQWLLASDIDYTFYDVRKNGLSLALLRHFVAKVEDWNVLVNRKSASMRSLSDQQILLSHTLENALLLLVEKPVILKRPILDFDQGLVVGFDATLYQNILQR